MKYLLILILFSFLVTWIVRGVIGYFARSLFQRANEQQSRQQNRTRQSRREGDIHIEKKMSRDKKIDKDMGEYVDYEEIQ